MDDSKKVKFISEKIKNAINCFDLNLDGKVVLTEAATGNYVVTSIIAALAGAEVIAFTKSSKYGTVEDVKKETYELADYLNISDKITIHDNLDEIDFSNIDIITNTGNLRPITEKILNKLPPSCVLPLMWEPWEFREGEIDLKRCHELGIKVYGTNEDDSRLRTKDYIGYTVLKLLLEHGLIPLNSKILLIGCNAFVDYALPILKNSGYTTSTCTSYDKKITTDDYNVFIILEHKDNQLLIGDTDEAFLSSTSLKDTDYLFHICGNVEISNALFNYYPEMPAPFGYMSFTTDYVSEQAVVDLHCAGLKVAEGMLIANNLGLNQNAYRKFLEENYPALAFDDKKYW